MGQDKVVKLKLILLDEVCFSVLEKHYFHHYLKNDNMPDKFILKKKTLFKTKKSNIHKIRYLYVIE